MADYRVYHVDQGGHIVGPPDEFTCDDDDVAIQRAKRLIDGHDVELWQLARLVYRSIPPGQ